MNGKNFVRIIEAELAKQNIRKGDFYKATGLSATAMYGWRNGATPKLETIITVGNFLGINFDEAENAPESAGHMDSETANLLEQIRSRPDLGVLLRSARDVPPSSVYELVSKLEKMKEDAN